ILEQIVGGPLAAQGELGAARLERLALEPPDLYALLRELGHYALAMGELDHAEQLYDRAREIFVLETQTIDDLHDEAADFGWLYLQRGALVRAHMPLPLVGAPVDLIDWLDLLQTGSGVHRELAAVVPAHGVLAALYDALPRFDAPASGAGTEHALVRGYRAVATDPAAARAELVAFRDAIATSG